MEEPSVVERIKRKEKKMKRTQALIVVGVFPTR
jgi:hypothetical protein